MTQDSQQIGFDDFMKVEVRVGTIARAEPFPEARRPAFKLWVDFGGELGVKKTSAQITRHYTGARSRSCASSWKSPPMRSRS